MAKPKSSRHQVRIIGGLHRGRKLDVLDKPGLRPTGDRIRETLFNWLQADIPGANVLDLFAGSGALGFEACSRESASVTMVEFDRQVVGQLKMHAETLKCPQCHIVHAKAEDFILQCEDRFDVVFLDPPFNSHLLTQVIESSAFVSILKSHCKVYVEMSRQEALQVPGHWCLLKEKNAGSVRYCLYQPT